jgi:hypothetical protein
MGSSYEDGAPPALEYEDEDGSRITLENELNQAATDEFSNYEASHMLLVTQKETRGVDGSKWTELHTHALFFVHFADFCRSVWKPTDSSPMKIGL